MVVGHEWYQQIGADLNSAGLLCTWLKLVVLATHARSSRC